MAGLNETLANAGIGTIVIGLYTAYVSYRSKGKDQHLAKETSSYDNLQEDNQVLRAALEKATERGDRYQALNDDCEQGRVEELTKFRDAMSADQFKRHELRSICRTALMLLADHNVPHEDLKRRVKALDKLP